jgi:uncharacterized membrane protein YagU involved in acid resistance
MFFIMNKIIIGAVAGLAATIPMTLLMVEWHRRLPREERYPLPPREIFDELIERVTVDDDLSETQKTNFSIASHFAYGTATGALYAPLISTFNQPSLTNGALYGVGVWAVSYLGWLPAFQILRPATDHPARRVALMIAAHVVWGGTLGIFTRKLLVQNAT